MRKTVTILALLAGMTLSASADSYTLLTLPESTSLSQTSTLGGSNYSSATGSTFLSSIVNKTNLSYGVYAGGNNNSISNWGTNAEGSWTCSSNTGSMTLCGRSGVAGDSFALVLGEEITSGTSLSSLTFSCTSPGSVISAYMMVLAVYDDSGSLVQSASESFALSTSGEATDTSVTLSLTDTLTWADGYTIVAGVICAGQSASGTSATSAYTISNISVSYTTAAVPEPATASLSLLGLGALLLRRRRH